MVRRAAVVWRVARDHQLSRIEVSFLGFSFAEHSTWLAILVFAYQRGGIGEAGVVAVVQLAPAMVVTPFAAYAGDRFPPERVLAVGYAVQSVSMAGTAIAMWAGHPLLAYAAGAVAATSITFTRPVMGAILPIVVRTPNDLVAANVVTGFTEYLGMFAGPLIGAVMLTAGTPALVFAVCAAVTGSSALLTTRVTLVDDEPRRHPSIDAGGAVSEIFGGVRALGEHNSLRLLVLLVSVGALTCGVNDVLMVSFAEARLDAGGGVAGILGGGLGIGAILGALVAAGLIGRSRLMPYLLGAAVLAGAPYFALAGIDALAPAAAMFLLFGMGESVLRVTTDVGIQRHAPDRVRARVFGVCEGLQMVLMALGSLLVSVLVGAIGLNSAMAIIGGGAALGVVLVSARFRSIGGDVPPPPEHIIERLFADPVFEFLGAPAVSRLADTLELVSVGAGEVVIAEGEPGDRYYLIVEGTAVVSECGRVIRSMGPGESFGEIALLRDVPRTATVRATTDVDLYAISREAFLETVTRHPRSMATADRIVGDLLPDTD